MDYIQILIKKSFKICKTYIRIIFAYLNNLDTPKQIDKQQYLKTQIKTIIPHIKIIDSQAERSIYSRDVSVIPKLLQKLLFDNIPPLVIKPTCESEIMEIIKFCDTNNINICPRGISSSPFGNSIPTKKTIILDLSLMNKIIELNLEKKLITVETGIKWSDVSSFLMEHNLTIKSMPSNKFSTVGGWIAGGGIGIYSFQEGCFHDNIVKLRVVTTKGIFTKTPNDSDFNTFVGSEGTLGIFTQVSFKINKANKHEESIYLLNFKSIKNIIWIIEYLNSIFVKPSHITFLNKTKMQEENLFFSIKYNQQNTILPERDCLLIVFNSKKSEEKFLEVIKQKNLHNTISSKLASTYIWNERFFPLKLQRLGPNLLACEFIVEIQQLPKITQKLNNLANKLGIKIGIEATMWTQDNKIYATVIGTFLANHTMWIKYLIKLIIVQIMMLNAIKYGAKPYGIGIWNLFWKNIDKKLYNNRLKLKKILDPKYIINPNKYFNIKTPLFNCLGFLFNPIIGKCIFNIINTSIYILAPIIKLILNEKSHNPYKEFNLKQPTQTLLDMKKLDIRFYHNLSEFVLRTAHRCTFCGSCIAVCPAYALTKNELTTGRGKLHFYKEFISKTNLEKYNFRTDLQDEYYIPFQCLKCKLCEEVCQSHLPLTACYDAMEKIILQKYQRWPHQLINNFIKKVDDNRTWLSYMYQLDIAQWSPSKIDPRLTAKKISEVLCKKGEQDE